MMYSKWNEEEVATYKRLTEGKEVTMERIEGLAYTAVHEMFLARMERKKQELERSIIIKALDQMADGMRTLEEHLGISLKEMADRHFQRELEEIRKLSEEK